MIETKFKMGNFLYPVKIIPQGERLEILFPFNRGIINEIKCWEAAKYHGYDKNNPRKIWSVANSQHNIFQIQYLEGKNPYKRYQGQCLEVIPKRPVYIHQKEGIEFVLARMHCILAFEMGLGKSLIGIEVLEALARDKGLESKDILWIGPKSALVSVRYEFFKWNSRLLPNFMTYEGLKKYVSSTHPTPKALILDESVKIKTPSSQRSQCARFVADTIRKDFGYDGLILLMSGAPAPKSPADWFFQAATACPGYLKEGDIYKFTNRLAWVARTENSTTGGMYPTLIGWKDNEDKCAICSKLKEDPEHEMFMVRESDPSYHQFQPSKNEVRFLYERMKGLVLVRMKKDCLKELPDKVYKTIHCKPSLGILNAAKLILKRSKTTIQALTLLRELSDGFNYQQSKVGTEVCPTCFGSGKIEIPDPQECPLCSGKGNVDKMERVTVELPCPKEDVITDLLDEYNDVGRVIIFGGFSGSLNKIIKNVHKAGWNYIKVDGSGWSSDLAETKNADGLYRIFQEKKDLYPKVAFVAQAAAGGIGLTLTASPVAIYYSNTFDANDRIQSEDRGHRPGMDINKGFTIIDILHLETDKQVLDNIQMKRDLQSLTLGDLVKALETTDDPLLIERR